MSSRLGLLEIECDAPSYPIVRACRKLGVESPEDVRWCRMSRRKGHHSWMNFFASHTWRHWLGKSQPEEAACICGHPLPGLETYSFTFQTGAQVDFEIGQCPCCRTIYWEKA